VAHLEAICGRLRRNAVQRFGQALLGWIAGYDGRPVFRTLRTLVWLMRASRTLGRASRLEKSGRNAAAAVGYADVIRQLDSIGKLPESPSEFSISDPANLSLRLVACSSLAVLRWKAGDPEGGKQLAREVLDICNRGEGVKELDKWAKWAREFIAPRGPLN